MAATLPATSGGLAAHANATGHAVHLLLTGRSHQAWEQLQEASDWAPQLAAAAGGSGCGIWVRAMRSRAAALQAGGQLHLAACHLLAIGDVAGAVSVYSSGGMPIEALALARCRLLPGDAVLAALHQTLHEAAAAAAATAVATGAGCPPAAAEAAGPPAAAAAATSATQPSDAGELALTAAASTLPVDESVANGLQQPIEGRMEEHHDTGQQQQQQGHMPDGSQALDVPGPGISEPTSTAPAPDVQSPTIQAQVDGDGEAAGQQGGDAPGLPAQQAAELDSAAPAGKALAQQRAAALRHRGLPAEALALQWLVAGQPLRAAQALAMRRSPAALVAAARLCMTVRASARASELDAEELEELHQLQASCAAEALPGSLRLCYAAPPQPPYLHPHTPSTQACMRPAEAACERAAGELPFSPLQRLGSAPQDLVSELQRVAGSCGGAAAAVVHAACTSCLLLRQVAADACQQLQHGMSPPWSLSTEGHEGGAGQEGSATGHKVQVATLSAATTAGAPGTAPAAAPAAADAAAAVAGEVLAGARAALQRACSECGVASADGLVNRALQLACQEQLVRAQALQPLLLPTGATAPEGEEEVPAGCVTCAADVAARGLAAATLQLLLAVAKAAAPVPASEAADAAHAAALVAAQAAVAAARKLAAALPEWVPKPREPSGADTPPAQAVLPLGPRLPHGGAVAPTANSAAPPPAAVAGGAPRGFAGRGGRSSTGAADHSGAGSVQPGRSGWAAVPPAADVGAVAAASATVAVGVTPAAAAAATVGQGSSRRRAQAQEWEQQRAAARQLVQRQPRGVPSHMSVGPEAADPSSALHVLYLLQLQDRLWQHRRQQQQQPKAAAAGTDAQIAPTAAASAAAAAPQHAPPSADQGWGRRAGAAEEARAGEDAGQCVDVPPPSDVPASAGGPDLQQQAPPPAAAEKAGPAGGSAAAPAAEPLERSASLGKEQGGRELQQRAATPQARRRYAMARMLELRLLALERFQGDGDAGRFEALLPSDVSLAAGV